MSILRSKCLYLYHRKVAQLVKADEFHRAKVQGAYHCGNQATFLSALCYEDYDT